MVTKQLTYTEALEQLNVSYGQEKIQLTAKVSSLEVTVGQQAIEIKKLQEVVEGDLTTCSIEAWDTVDEQVERIRKLEKLNILYEEIVNEWLNKNDITELDWQAIKDRVLGG